jgi:hypothetical protein
MDVMRNAPEGGCASFSPPANISARASIREARHVVPDAADLLAQYAGRLHWLHAAKRTVIIYDHVDAGEPVLAKMAAKREAGCNALRYEVAAADDALTRMGTPAELFG